MKGKTLVLFLGNPLLSDDRIGLELGMRLKERLEQRGYEVKLEEKAGLALLDYLWDRDEAIIVDSIKTGSHQVGEVFTPSVEELGTTTVVSSHYVGIPETLHLLKALDLNLQCHVHIIAVEVDEPYTISEELSKDLRENLEEITEEVYYEITQLLEPKRPSSTK
jgi:hydrogenase maturation protease